MTLEEKYQIAVKTLKSIVARAREGGDHYYDDIDYSYGYDAGLEAQANEADDVLILLGETDGN